MAFSDYTEREKQLVRKIEELGDKLGSFTKAAEAIGISGAAISGLRSGKYGGKSGAMFDKVEKYFGVKEEADSVEETRGDDDTYKPTSISEEICAVIKNCQLNGGLAVVSGHAGIGKTMAVNEFARRNPSLTKVINVTECTKSIKSVLKLLSNEFMVNKGATDEMWFNLVDKMHDKMVLIFDEAQLLPHKTIEMIRSFPDYFQAKGQTLGVVFVGNLELSAKFSGSYRLEYAQIVSRTRLNQKYFTDNIQLSDARMIFGNWSGDDMMMEFMHSICKSHLGIRGTKMFYQSALDSNINDYESLLDFAKVYGLNI